MKAELILIRDDHDLAQAQDHLADLMAEEGEDAIARAQAQALLIEAYETKRYPSAPPSIPDLLEFLMDQHDLTRADLVPLLGTPSRVSEVLGGKKGLSMAMILRLRERFGIPADLLIPAVAARTVPAQSKRKRAATSVRRRASA
jgi:HTH-type transcriptional regulator/antitoxin HigA